MNEEMIRNLELALESILSKDDKELFADFQTPGSRYFFSDIHRIDKELGFQKFTTVRTEWTTHTQYRVGFFCEQEIKPGISTVLADDYACAA